MSAAPAGPDLDEVSRLTAELEASRRRLAQLEDFVENATIGLHRVGPDGRILWANQAELDMLGYTREEYLGRPVADFHADPHVIEDILARLRRKEALHGVEARLKARDGSIRHVLISSSVLDDGHRDFVHTRCFTRDITERRRAEDALRASERQLKAITDALPVFVSFVGADLRYRFVNATYQRLLGQAPADVVGRRVDEVLGEAAFATVRPYVEQALGGVTGVFEAEITYRNGVTRTVEGSYVPQRDDAGAVAGFVGLVSDVTEKKALERFRERATARAERLLRVTAAIADAVTAEEVHQALIGHAADAVSADSAGLWLLDDGARTARLVSSRGYPEAVRAGLATVELDAGPRMPVLDALRTGVPQWCSSQAELLERYPHLAGTVTPGREYRVACLPLISGDRVLGALAYTLGAGQEADERGFLLLVARYAAQAVERLRLLEAERRSRLAAAAAAHRLEVLGRASRRFVETDLDLEGRLEEVVRELGAALASGIAVVLRPPVAGSAPPVATFHPEPQAHAELARLARDGALGGEDGLAGEVLRSGRSALETVIEPATVAMRLPAYRDFLERYPAPSALCVPLRARDRVLGSVTALATRPGQAFSREDLTLFEDLADRAAAALENSRLYQESVEAARRAEELYRFAQAVTAADRVDQVFEAALDAVEAALSVSRSAVLTVDDGGRLTFRAWRGVPDQLKAAVEAVAPWTTPVPVVVSELSADPSMAAVAPALASEGIAAVALIPVASGPRVLGTFVLMYQDRGVGLHDVNTARTIANHLGSVITRFAAVTRLEDTVRQNELFAGVLAHDLRNPLSAMMNAAQLLLMRREGEAGAPDRETRPLGRILTAGQRMTAMIDQLLDFTRVRSGGGLVLEPAPTDLSDLVTQAVGELELAHPEWRVVRHRAGDLRGQWDADRLLQVVSNLVANAGQHGQPGEAITVRLDGTDPGLVRLSVHNHGRVPPALLPGLFEPFRSTRHRRDQSRGLGLGLYIVREIIRAHGGTVEVTSSESGGTTFFLWLPRGAPRQVAGGEDQTPVRGLEAPTPPPSLAGQGVGTTGRSDLRSPSVK